MLSSESALERMVQVESAECERRQTDRIRFRWERFLFQLGHPSSGVGCYQTFDRVVLGGGPRFEVAFVRVDHRGQFVSGCWVENEGNGGQVANTALRRVGFNLSDELPRNLAPLAVEAAARHSETMRLAVIRPYCAPA